MTKGLKRMIVALCALTAFLVAPAVASAAKLSLTPSSDGVVFGKRLAIEGKLTPDAGVPAGGHVVRLFAKPYPYKKSKSVATTTTDETGAYSFPRVKPNFNTRYRTAVGDPAAAARSASKLVPVFPNVALKVRATKSSQARSNFRLRYSPKLPLRLSGRRVLWYFHRVGTASFRVRDRSKIKARRGVARSSSSFPIKRGNYNFEVTFCIVLPDRRDIGLGSPSKRRGCPKSFPASNGRTAARLSAGAGSHPASAPITAAQAGRPSAR